VNAEADWREVFGHAEPYDAQVDGVETAVETAREGGFTVIEGACGTGKTMLALTAGVSLVRDSSTRFERVVVLTSVKQQLRQFEEDLRTVNAGIEDRPVSGVTLVGKADVCPYAREGLADVDERSVYERCEGLRERTRSLANSEATSARELAADARQQQTAIGGEARYLETAGEPAPYEPDTAEAEDTEYCPFYAQFLADLPEEGDAAEAIPFEVEGRGLLDTEDVVRLSVQHGTCPHSMLGALLGEVEVVVGNYYHAFDPTTAASFTGPLLDESTFVVCDEAHMLEPRVRDLVGDRVADDSLRDAIGELTRVIQPLASADAADRGGATGVTGPDSLSGTGSDVETIRAELAEVEVSRRDLERTREFLDALREELDRRVSAHLEREHVGWRSRAPRELRDDELPLRDPTTPEPDGLTEWADREGYGDRWILAEAAGAFVGRVLDELDDEDSQRAAPGVGRTLADWARLDHESYFRSLELESTFDDTHPTDSWRRRYNARLNLHNCVPSGPIADRLGEFGGGVLMSATLEPIDVFAEVTGLDRLEADGRPVARRTYGLHFPAENRESFAVAAPKFTYDERGPTPEDGATPTEARRAHRDAVREVAGVEGNVLVGMPSYAEAEWMARALRPVLEKEVLVDESSGADATDDLKSEFFAGPGKVLVTSLRGTLTEGVDYRGDRLRAAVVCGVPIVNTASPRTKAVRAAYDRVFGDGFRYALTVPAVRKARQAIGRVIRGPEETGVRVLVDQRYAREDWDSVRDLVPDHEGFRAVSPDMLSLGLERFEDRTDRA
jgi:DNA excision repair protein ERCC-2